MKKRMFTMIFAIIMVIAVSIPCVSAATSELTTTKKVSFTAECSKPGYEFSVYKIADLKTTTNPYSVKYDVKVSSGEVQAMVADGNLSDANRAKILNALDKDTQLAGASIVGTYKVDTDGKSKTFSDLAQGIYYVRATNFPSGVKKVTNSAFALPYYTAENGWVYDLDTINLAAKVEEDNPDIEKEITNSTQNNVNFTDVSIGDTVEFKIESSVVGAVNNVDVLDFKLNSYVVTDIMSKGLTLNQKSFALSLEDENDKNLAEIAASDYTVNVTAEAGRDTNFTVSLKKSYLQKNEFYSADHVAIRFSAVLNKYATTEPVGNPNEAVKLTYTNKNDVKGEITFRYISWTRRARLFPARNLSCTRPRLTLRRRKTLSRQAPPTRTALWYSTMLTKKKCCSKAESISSRKPKRPPATTVTPMLFLLRSALPTATR